MRPDPWSGCPRSVRGCSDRWRGRDCRLPCRGPRPGARCDGASWSSSWSEAQVEAEEEALARRERGHVDVPDDGLIAEVADLGIEAAIAGEAEQVPAAHREPDVAGGPAEQTTGDVVGQVVRQRDLPELEVGRVLD